MQRPIVREMAAEFLGTVYPAHALDSLRESALGWARWHLEARRPDFDRLCAALDAHQTLAPAQVGAVLGVGA